MNWRPRAILSMRDRHEAGDSIRALADDYGTSYSAMRRIIRGESYAWVTGEEPLFATTASSPADSASRKRRRPR